MLATDDGRFYWYSWVLKIMWLLIAICFPVKKRSLVSQSWTKCPWLVECWIFSDNLIAATSIDIIHASKDEPTTVTPKTGTSGAALWKRHMWSLLVRKRIGTFCCSFTTKCFWVCSKLGYSDITLFGHHIISFPIKQSISVH